MDLRNDVVKIMKASLGPYIESSIGYRTRKCCSLLAMFTSKKPPPPPPHPESHRNFWEAALAVGSSVAIAGQKLTPI